MFISKIFTSNFLSMMQRRHQTFLYRTSMHIIYSLVESILYQVTLMSIKVDNTYGIKTIRLILTFTHLTWKSVEIIHSPSEATSLSNVVVKGYWHLLYRTTNGQKVRHRQIYRQTSAKWYTLSLIQRMT